MTAFGKYGTLIFSVLVSIAIFATILTLCGCCCIPCLRTLVNRIITTAISLMETRVAQMYTLLEVEHLSSEAENSDDGEEEGKATPQETVFDLDLFFQPK